MSVTIAPQYTQRSYTWLDWKNIQSIKNFVYQYDDNGVNYTIWGYDGPEVSLTTLWKGIVPDGIINGGYSQAQNDADKSDFETNYKFYGNKPIELKTTDGRIRFAAEKSDIKKLNFYTFDWSDKTTWYEHAAYIVSESATNSGDNLTFNLSHNYIIDNYHGKITLEDFLRDSNNNSFRVVVNVSGNTLIEQDPHYASGGDYIVNYESGSITFLNPQTSSVYVNYHYAQNSIFTIEPPISSSLSIASVEAQFADDIIMTDSVKFTLYGYVDVFAPQLIPMIPSGTKIPLANPMVYKSFTDFQNEADKAYPAYPKMGGNNWRAAEHSIFVFDWDYVSSITLRSDYGMEIQVQLEHDTPFDGWYATATFYCLTEPLI